MLIKELVNGVEHYLSVESNYKDPSEGKGKSDGVVFEMGRLGNGIDSCVIVSADDARSFANSILQTCDEIEGECTNKMGYERTISHMATKNEALEREVRRLKGEQTPADIEYEQYMEALVSRTRKALGIKESATKNK